MNTSAYNILQAMTIKKHRKSTSRTSGISSNYTWRLINGKMISKYCWGLFQPYLSSKVQKIWVCLKMGYTPNYSHLVGIMIINHWV